ncbi:MAG: RagB/SusD family nutrient uptake outer membrane protein [Lewinellaceae bacterium]|nr:RagB/SusD family nutrient uptake outer membrane protein [Lewinellaceae bacterium]
MMNHRIIAITILLLAAALFSCEDFLDVQPETEVSVDNFYESRSDFEQAVTGIYAPLQDIYEEDWEMTELRSDNTHFIFDVANRGTKPTEDLGTFTVETNNITVFNKWSNNYLVISRANLVLNAIDEADFDQAVKDNLKGQAFFLRALAYFDLVNNFGGVPLFLEAPKSYDETFKPRASAGDIYDQVIADATEAAGLLPGKDSQSPGRATRGAASTLLADAYMTLKRWGEAEAVLKEVQGMGYSLLPEYADIFRPANEGNSEIIFEVDYIEGTAFSLESVFPYDFLPELEDITVITGSSPPQRGGGAFNIPTPELLASYEDTLLDKRYAASIGRYTGPSPLPGVEYVRTPYCRKYLHPHAITGQTGQNWIVYRYADVLLMLAECLNEQGKAGEALPLLNQVRMRAGLGDSSASGQDGVREAILSERRVELAFENKRWKDLIRNGTAVAVVNAFGAKVKANPQEYYYPAGSAPFPNSFQVDANRLIYPIPVSEIIINPELSQNLGY